MKHPYLNFTFSKPRKKLKTVSVRLAFLFAENSSSSILQSHELELAGIIDMAKGLEYHYKNFKKIEKKYLASYEKIFKEMILSQIPGKENMIHEAVAYLNRLGQIETLITAPWFKTYITEETLVNFCPKIFALMPLRNKFTAHRSIDDPRNETESQKASQASIPFGIQSRGPIGGLPKVSYSIKIAKEERRDSRKTLLATYHKLPVQEIEHFSETEVWITFTPTKHHEEICSEIVTVLRYFFEKATR